MHFNTSSKLTFSLKTFLVVLTVLFSVHTYAVIDAFDDSATTTEGTSVVIAVLDNDLEDGGAFASSVLDTDVCIPLVDASNPCELNELDVGFSNPNSGTISLSGRDIVYTPNEGFVGVDSFIYAAFQAEDSSSERFADADDATVTITVTAATSSSSASEDELDDVAGSVDSLCESVEDTGGVDETTGDFELTATPEDVRSACTALDDLSEADREEALSTLLADQVASQASTSISMIQDQGNNISSRLSQIKSGTTGVNANALTLNNYGQKLDGKWLHAIFDQISSQESLTGGSAGEEQPALSPFGFFINGSITTGDKDSSTNERGYDLDSNNFTLGMDYRFSNELVGGVAYGYGSNSVEFNSTGDEMENDMHNFIFYGTWFKDSFYLDGTLGFASGSIETDRRIVIPMAVDTIATGDTDTSHIMLQIAGGIDFSSGPLSFGPYGRLDIIDGEIEGYEEQNGDGFEVTFEDQDISSQILTLGAQAQYAISYDWGVLLPTAKLEMKNEFDDENDAITGRFSLDTGNSEFTITADDVDGFWFQSGIGLTALFPAGLSAYIDYETVMGLNDITLNTYSFGGRWEMDF